MLSILYPYRNRDSKRIKRSFDSLLEQTNKNFEVFFIDYGSTPDLAVDIKRLCQNYPFISYQFYPTQYQPWNKSRALNSVIKNLKTDFCFVADVDVIFHPEFVETAYNLTKTGQTTYFQVGYLSSSESRKTKAFSEYSDYRLSTNEATGLSLFPVAQLKELNGFDEFYHFWGAEDTDMHIRLKNAGYGVKFYDEELLLLHQWHPSYQSRERTGSTSELKLSGILPLNHQHLKNAMKNGITKINNDSWGENLSKEEFDELEEAALFKEVTNEKRQVEDVLFGQLPGFKTGIIKIRIVTDPFEDTLKYKTKRLLGKKVPEYYTLTEVNDKVLLHLISFYRDIPYSVKVNHDNYEIEVAIKFS
ncbi:glycosyltransferase family A protein [Gramella sp. MAR_2010_147]|uniref:glycosyltransferase family 2 protein n=1 Tax=Gramella sp. MAR_2010_147 TaxID=1250205 RepID=UPI00087C5D26|nr:glycosyltransferase family A protein [Gramella sp. MAR_2010_147]SDS01454.1 Glycosyltransferase like family 2 [Gramella sp. MAR_2010_147]